MFAAIDIGNTNITIGFFDGDVLKEINRLHVIKDKSYNYQSDFENIFATFHITDCAIASVVDELTDIITDICNKITGKNALVLTSDLNFGMTLKVQEPNKTGIDRIINAAIVNKLYKTPTVVVDTGTAITLDVISKDGCFLGGIIMAGLELHAKALFMNTSKLPKIELDEIDNVIGTNTQTSLLSGVIRGSACAVDGLLEECEQEIGEPITVIGTGGDIKLLAKYMKRKFDCINPNLTLQGLKYIYDLNQN